MTTSAENTAVVAPLVSIVIPCCGMLEYTKLCLPSVHRYSREPIELIFVDIGSLDGTLEYLEGWRDALTGRVRIEICRAQTDLEIATACKEALGLARGEFVCLLNNDTVVTSNWLDGLTAMAKFAPTHGLVGPMANMAPEAQRVEPVPYRMGPRKNARPGEALVDVQAVTGFAREFHGKHKGQYMQVERLGGFCLLIRRDALERVRPALAEWTDLGLFDIDIVSMKARQDGFAAVVCRDLYIHHFGTRTFRNLGCVPRADGRTVAPHASAGHAA